MSKSSVFFSDDDPGFDEAFQAAFDAHFRAHADAHFRDHAEASLRADPGNALLQDAIQIDLSLQ